METFNLSHHTFNNLLHKLLHAGSHSKGNADLKTPNLQYHESSGRQVLKSAVQYTVKAIGTGLKQNLLGADVNTEFITLTAQAFYKSYLTGPLNQLKSGLNINQHSPADHNGTEINNIN